MVSKIAETYQMCFIGYFSSRLSLLWQYLLNKLKKTQLFSIFYIINLVKDVDSEEF